MSEFYIYGQGERLGVLQHAVSVQWLESYQSPGEVKIDARVTPDNLALLVSGNRVYNPDCDTAAIISHVDITAAEAEELITVRADITSRLLNRRVVMATENVSNAEAGMYSIYSKNRRGLPIGVGTTGGYTECVNMEITWNSVLEGVSRLAASSGLGFKVVFDPGTGAETFTVYKGIDRSKEDSPGYTGYFGTDVENLQNVTVSSGVTGYKNVAVVAGAGEGASREVCVVALGEAKGEDRRELYVDARDISREYQLAIPTGEVDSGGNPVYRYESRTYTDAEYTALLRERGLEKLSENLKDFEITCDIAQNNIAYGVDYFLGDRMPVKLPEYGIYASARISSVTMIYEKEGDKIVALLGEFELEGDVP